MCSFCKSSKNFGTTEGASRIQTNSVDLKKIDPDDFFQDILSN